MIKVVAPGFAPLRGRSVVVVAARNVIRKTKTVELFFDFGQKRHVVVEQIAVDDAKIQAIGGFFALQVGHECVEILSKRRVGLAVMAVGGNGKAQRLLAFLGRSPAGGNDCTQRTNQKMATIEHDCREFKLSGGIWS